MISEKQVAQRVVKKKDKHYGKYTVYLNKAISNKSLSVENESKISKSLVGRSSKAILF
jgi:hypothetical protein